MRDRPWLLVSAAWIGPALLGAINEIAQQRLSGDAINIRAVLFTSFDWLLYAFLTPAVFRLAAHWPLARPHLVARVALHVLFSLLFCVAWAGAGTLLRMALMPKGLWGTPAQHFLRWFFITLPFGAGVYFAVVGIEHAIRYFVEARESEAQMARLSEQLSRARLTALQSSVNPHFLFNTLNTISVLVREGDRAAATRIIEQFSEVMRRALGRGRAHEVMLSEELELVEQYLAIEQARFADRLHPVFDVDDDALSAAIPSFALQQLVENAVRHGIAKRAEAGVIVVRVGREGELVTITVTDDGPGVSGEPVAPGHSLENTRERLRALHGERASLEVRANPGGGTIATMRFPYREVVLESGLA